MSSPFALRPTRQALVVVDMQNDFLRVGAPQEVPEGRDIIHAIGTLSTAFEELDRPVIYTRFIAGPGDTLMTTWSPECGPEQRSCWPGVTRTYADRPGVRLEGPGVVDELEPSEDAVVIDKYGYGAFHDTILEDVLRTRRCDQIVVTGVITQICVEDTVRQAFHRGLEAVVVRDAVASFDAELHHASLRNLDMKFAAVLDSGQVLEALVAARRPATAGVHEDGQPDGGRERTEG